MKRRLFFRSFVLAALGAVSFAAGSSGCGCGPEIVPEGSGIFVVNADARACDVVFKSTVDEVPSINFTSLVVGEAIPRAPYVAVSFVAAQEAAIDNQELGRASFSDASGALELVRAECFDQGGGTLQGDTIGLGQ